MAALTWGFRRGTRKQEVKGAHTLEGDVLAMEPDSDGVLLAVLTPKEPDTLQAHRCSSREAKGQTR